MKFFYLIGFCLTAQNFIKKFINMLSTKENNNIDSYYYVRYEKTKNVDNSEGHHIDIIKSQPKKINHLTAENTDENEKE
ncbi:uncharacterized protein VNE69_09033 [Vairimorpha necatrix]|uniref:Uncharacterized protein n=1 Tax=Vairimorpha necatrix TaxID=6039 RepID=A0AAX4JF66_9MICR